MSIDTKKQFLAIKIIFLLMVMLTFGVAIALAQEPDDDEDIPVLPDTPYEYTNITLPNHFNAAQITNADNTPLDNPITNDGATLGRVLFYDKRLSANDTIACASCHIQTNGFADPNQLSTGFEGGLTGRNSMGLSNARYFQPGSFFWDERAPTLEAQTLMPIQDSVEMGMDLADLVTKLEAEEFYPPLFENAFGTDEITSDRIARALAQFVRSLVSYQSKYDQGVATNFSNFTPQENQGRRIFFGRGRCNICHTTDLFIVEEAINNGLDATTTDAGLGAVTGNTADDGKFKSPSLRNIALTAPYMHDGRFSTLAEVVNFYNSNVQAHPNLDPRLRQAGGQPRRLGLNQAQQQALVAFLETLTDQTIVNDSKFSDPFTATFFNTYLPLILK